MIVCDVEQNSPEWFEIRAGKITGTKAKQAHSADAKSLIYELISEQETGCDQDVGFVSDSMLWGTEQEPLARAYYEEVNGIKLNQSGLLINDEYDWIAISPDGWREDENGILGVEIKCPNTEKHIMIINEEKIGSTRDYWDNQVFHWFQIDKRVYAVDFVSFDVRFEKNKMKVIRVYRKDHEARIEKETQNLLKLKTQWDSIHQKVTF
jgi:putative phage-type endonuclease